MLGFSPLSTLPLSTQPAAAVGADGNATGAQASIAFNANAATANGTNGSSNGAATASNASLSLAANSGAATASSTASGLAPSISFSANGATATGSANGVAAGQQASLSLGANAATASASSTVTAANAGVNFSAASATATGTNGASNGSAVGANASLSLGAASATASGTATASANNAAISFTANTAVALSATTAVIGQNTGQTPGVQDTLLRDAPGQQDTNFSNNVQLGASNFAAGDAATTVIRFGLTSIPANATILSASLTFTLGNNAGFPTLGLRRALPNWDIAGSTWNSSATGTAWGSPGARLDGTDRAAAVSSSLALTSGQAGTITFDGLAADVQAMLLGDNNGWQLDRIDGGTNDGQFCVLNSSEAADGLRPFLSVVYLVPVIPPPDVGPPSSGGVAPNSFTSRTRARLGLDRARMERRERALKHRQEAETDPAVQAMVAQAVEGGKGLKDAFDSVRDAQKGLVDAERRLIAFLEAQERALFDHEEAQIVKIMAELL